MWVNLPPKVWQHQAEVEKEPDVLIVPHVLLILHTFSFLLSININTIRLLFKQKCAKWYFLLLPKSEFGVLSFFFHHYSQHKQAGDKNLNLQSKVHMHGTVWRHSWYQERSCNPRISYFYRLFRVRKLLKASCWGAPLIQPVSSCRSTSMFSPSSPLTMWDDVRRVWFSAHLKHGAVLWNNASYKHLKSN